MHTKCIAAARSRRSQPQPQHPAQQAVAGSNTQQVGRMAADGRGRRRRMHALAPATAALPRLTGLLLHPLTAAAGAMGVPKPKSKSGKKKPARPPQQVRLHRLRKQTRPTCLPACLQPSQPTAACRCGELPACIVAGTPACHAATPHVAEASSTAAGMFMPECTRMRCQPAPELYSTATCPPRPSPPCNAADGRGAL